MPTIDQLAPATAATDADEFLVSQAGIARKISRAQVLAGVQPGLAIPAGALLGRVSAGSGAPEAVAVGANLTLSSGTLSAAGASFSVSGLPKGVVPAAADQVAIGQGGTNVSVTYRQFLSGLSAVPNIDASQVVVTPVGGTASVRLSDLAASIVPITGTTMTGPLVLSGPPLASNQAASKAYVDSAIASPVGINVRSSPYNARLDGVTDDTAAFKAAYQAAPAGAVIYVPFGVTVLQPSSAWGIPLTKRVKWAVDGTVLADGTPLAAAIPNGVGAAGVTLPGVVTGNSGVAAEFSQSGSQSSDFAVLHTSYVVNHTGGPGNVITNTRNDSFVFGSPGDFVWGGLDRLVWYGTQTPSAATPAQHVGRYVQTVRANTTTDSSGRPLPQPQLWAACLEYRDVTGKPSSAANASLTVEMDWFGNGADDAGNRQIQSLVVGQHDKTGAAVEVANVIGVYLSGGSSGKVNRVFNVAIPFGGAVLDTTAAQQLTGASAIRLAAGHSIAFEPSGVNRLSFDSSTNSLRWNQGNLSYVVGKGITVGWQNVLSGAANLPAYIAGNIIFLTGSGSYTVTLPAAAQLAPGVGFTFSVIGSVVVSIAQSGGDGIDAGPIVLRQNDRYHIVSDGTNTWREVFRTNLVNPRFSAPPVLPSYSVAALPAGSVAGAKAFASNGRKPGEAAGAGTGVEVFNDGSRWISGCTGSTVTA